MQGVLVLGSPRGGTTWVGQALARCRGASYVHEPDGAHEPFAFRARRHDRLGQYPILGPDAAAPEFERLWAGALGRVQARSKVRDAVARRAFGRASPAERNRALAGGRMTPSLFIADVFTTPPAVDAGAEFVVAKSVNSALAADWISRRFQPSVLVVRRDLRNIVASWLGMGWTEPRPGVFTSLTDHARAQWGIELVRADEDPIARQAAVCSAVCVVLLLALHDGLRRHSDWREISHEAACGDPVTRLADAARSVGLEWTDAADEFVRASNRPGTGYSTQRVAEDLPESWKARLSPLQVEVVEDIHARIPPELWTVPISP